LHDQDLPTESSARLVLVAEWRRSDGDGGFVIGAGMGCIISSGDGDCAGSVPISALAVFVFFHGCGHGCNRDDKIR